MKIYDDDPEVYARTTKIPAIRSKAEIDGVLMKQEKRLAKLERRNKEASS